MNIFVYTCIASIRLVDGTNNLEGRIEIYINGGWGTICDDSFDDTDAAVVCRQLGLSAGMHFKIKAI